MSVSPPPPGKKPRRVRLGVACAGATLLSLLCVSGVGMMYYLTRPTPPPDFDPNNLDRTAQWAMLVSRRAQALGHDEGALDEYVGQLTAECQGHVGKEVHWSIPVEAVTHDQVELKVRWCDDPQNSSTPATSPTLTLQRAGAPIPAAAVASLPLNVDDEIPRERADRLRRGSVVNVTATVADIELRPYAMTDGSRAIELVIVLDGLRAD